MAAAPGEYVPTNRRVTCKRCGAGDLAWYQNKAGRWYLAMCLISRDENKRRNDVRYIAPWQPHRCP
jgi:hypothetical protein